MTAGAGGVWTSRLGVGVRSPRSYHRIPASAAFLSTRPTMTRRSTLLVLLAVLLAAAPTTAQTYYEDIRPVLVENCVRCHSESGIAWSMEDAEATYERARRISRAIDLRRMPPFLAEPGHQEYVGDISLPEETLAMVRRWAEAGHPKGTERPDPEPIAMAGHHSAFEGDVTLEVLPGTSYLPEPSRDDDYRCFLVDWTEDAESYITGFRAVPGNTNVAHHVVVYAVQPEMWERYKELEDGEEGPGYQCFGGALPDRLGNRTVRAEYEERYPDGVRQLNRANFWLAHWAPGMDGHVFPEGTGLRMEPGSGLVVQMHYYSGDAPGERDAETRMDFMTEATVERPAVHLAQTRGEWLGSSRNETMVVPPGEMRTFAYRDRLGDLVNYIGAVTGVDPADITGLELHSANLHMHAFGHSGEITLQHETGELETLLSVPRWDLDWQRDFTFAAPKIFDLEALDDVFLDVRCTYENPTDQTVYGGYGSFDEMCFNFSYIAVVQGTPTEGEPASRE